MTSIALRPESSGVTAFGAGEPDTPNVGAADDEWARLWFTLERHGWGSLALVPAARGASARVLAARLARVAAAPPTVAQRGAPHARHASTLSRAHRRGGRAA